MCGLEIESCTAKAASSNEIACDDDGNVVHLWGVFFRFCLWCDYCLIPHLGRSLKCEATLPRVAWGDDVFLSSFSSVSKRFYIFIFIVVPFWVLRLLCWRNWRLCKSGLFVSISLSHKSFSGYWVDLKWKDRCQVTLSSFQVCSTWTWVRMISQEHSIWTRLPIWSHCEEVFFYCAIS